MLMYRRTSILESNAQTLVNTVNCVGVMGKGIAKAFKQRDPAMFDAYKRICNQQLLKPGMLWLWQGPQNWVLNFPTKLHWRNPSRIEWIEAGLAKFVAEYAGRGITNVSFPCLGCGNGGLDWNDVKPIMERYLRDLPIPVFIHDFMLDLGLPEHLEDVAKRLKAECASPTSFDAFITGLRRVADLGGDRLVDLTGQYPFQARADQEGNLLIETESAAWALERDDLWGIWLSLQSGLVTREKAGWSQPAGSDAVLSMLSVLPYVRHIEIQHHNREPEIAVELLLPGARTATVPEGNPQNEFAWA